VGIAFPSTFTFLKKKNHVLRAIVSHASSILKQVTLNRSINDPESVIFAIILIFVSRKCVLARQDRLELCQAHKFSYIEICILFEDL